MLQERSARVVVCCCMLLSSIRVSACDAQLAHDEAKELLRMLQDRPATRARSHASEQSRE